MKCPNPACGGETFKVRVVWKQRIREFPEFLPVELTCIHCGRKIKACVLNENLRDLVRAMNILGEKQSLISLILSEIKSILKERSKPWWRRS